MPTYLYSLYLLSPDVYSGVKMVKMRWRPQSFAPDSAKALLLNPPDGERKGREKEGWDKWGKGKRKGDERKEDIREG